MPNPFDEILPHKNGVGANLAFKIVRLKTRPLLLRQLIQKVTFNHIGAFRLFMGHRFGIFIHRIDGPRIKIAHLLLRGLDIFQLNGA